MSTFESNINKLQKALENIKSVKGRIYEGTTIRKGMDIEKKLNEAIRSLESAKDDYNTLMKREEECKKNTMSEEEFKKVFTVERTSEHLHREFQLNESEIDYLKKVANKSMYKVYCNFMRDKFNLDPISKVSVVGDITGYRAEYDEKEQKIKIKDDDGKAIAEYKPDLSITGLEIKDKEGHVLYQKDCSKKDDKKSIVLRITDDALAKLVYEKKGAVLYNHHTEAIELMWNLSLQENKYVYGFRIINLQKRFSFFASVYAYNTDNGIDFKKFKCEFMDGVSKTIDDIVPKIKAHLDSTRTKEIEFLFDEDADKDKNIKVTTKKPIVLRITDDALKRLVYEKKGAILYNHHTEAIELMWNLSLQENAYAYGFSIINLNRRYSFFERIYEYNLDNGIDFKMFKHEFINELNKRKTDIIFDIRTYLDSIRTKEIEFKFDEEEK